MTLSWVSVNANTGDIIADLPTLKIDGPLKRTIGRYETQTGSLPLGDMADPMAEDRAPDNWRQATRKKAVFLVALNEDQNPVWGGMVTERITSHQDPVQLSMVTAEDYFNDRYVGDEDFTGISQNTIVKTLVEKYARTGDRPGIPIRVQILPGPDPMQDRTYSDDEDKTLYTALDELSGVLGGPEWTISWERTGDRITPVLYVGGRIGAPKPAGLGAAAQFYLPGNLQDAQLTESYRRGKGANDVMAVSSGAGAARPQSPRRTAPPDLRPTVEHRWSPDTNITEDDVLTGHADRALAGMKDGAVALAIIANREEAPPLGADWDLGDDIGFDITSPAWPEGITGTARVLALEITDTTITPVLDVTGIEGIE